MTRRNFLTNFWPNGLPSACELCGKAGYGFIFHPIVRVCRECFQLPAMDILRRCREVGIDAMQRNPIEPDDADVPSRRE